MAEYKVKRDYAAIYSRLYGEEVVLSFRKGEVVEIEDGAQAEWVERDSPGTLEVVGPQKDGGKPRALGGPGKDRQVRGASKR